MRCQSCQALTAESRRMGLQHLGAGSGRQGPMGGLLCERCGALLESVDAVDAMLRKLSQLARFGLGAGAGPLLTRTKKGD